MIKIANALLAASLVFSSAAAQADEFLEAACPGMVGVQTVIIDSDFDQDFNAWNKVVKISEITPDSAMDTAIPLFFNPVQGNGETADGSHSGRPENSSFRYLLIVNSPGGDVISGRSVVDAFRLSQAEITALCMGQASSMGSVLLASSDKAYAMPGCRMITHETRMNLTSGQYFADDLLDYYHRLQEGSRMLRKTYMSKAGIGETCARYLVRRADTTLTAEDALRLGLVDAVLRPEGKMEVRADDPRVGQDLRSRVDNAIAQWLGGNKPALGLASGP